MSSITWRSSARLIKFRPSRAGLIVHIPELETKMCVMVWARALG